MKWFLFISFLALVLIASISSQACPPNQRYLECGTCDQICDQEPRGCAAVCRKPGCYCERGYLRANPSNSSECVEPSNCPGQCSVNEEYNSCGGCDQICNEEPIFCIQSCSYPGCYCKNGYVRAFRGRSICIPKFLCLFVQGPRSSLTENEGQFFQGPSSSLTQNKGQQQCRVNEVYKYCGGCDQYCNEGPVSCTADCRPGCYCKDCYVRSFRGGICIPISTCPRAQDVDSALVQNTGAAADLSLAQSTGPAPQDSDSSLDEYTGQQQCRVNEIYKYCGGCDQYCNKPPVSCTAECRPGCYCRVGFKRSFPGGICIPKSICPAPQDSDSSLDEYAGQPQCSVNEVYKYCGGCDQYCNKPPVSCTADCRPGCYCRVGFKRSFLGGICIPNSICPAPQDSDSSLDENAGKGFGPVTGQQQCSVNEVYKYCGGCDQYCNEGPVICTEECRPGCYCQVGYKRSFPGGICIPKSICPVIQDSDSSMVENTGQQRCGVNEVYKYCCGCDQYCNKEPVICTADCRPGCYCQVGFKRSFPGGICIPKSLCPVIQDSDSSLVENTGPLAHEVDSSFVENAACGENEVFNQCGVGKECEDYCGRGPNACAYCRPGCYCKRGYIRSGPESNAKCIRKNRCPHVLDASPSFAQGPGYDCRPDEVYDICGVGPECENYCGRGANACAYCQAGCYCKQGTIRAGASNRTRCIPENKCPVAQKCFKNEVYSDCGTACPANCDNKNPVCTLECVADCFCKEGFIRMHADVQAKRYECIPQDQCPP